MKYVIVHVIRGEAQKAHEAIVKNLVEKFDMYPLYEYVPAHLTLKRSFESDAVDIESIYKTLEDFTKTHSQSNYQLKGFGHFDDRAVYIDAIPSPETIQNHTELQESLSKIPGIVLDEFDRRQKLHATVALGQLKAYNLAEIWPYVQNLPQPDFSMKFDNVAVFKKIEGKWAIDRVFEIGQL